MVEARRAAAVVAGTLLAGTLWGVPGRTAQPAGPRGFAARAQAIADALHDPDSVDAAQAALTDAFKAARVTIVGERDGTMQIVHKGFGRSRRDLFLTESQIAALANVALQQTTSPVGELATAINVMAPEAEVTPDEAAIALRKWVRYGRSRARHAPGDSTLFIPYLVDRLAAAQGVDLAAAVPETDLPGIAAYLTLMTLAPGKARPATTSRRSTVAADPCGFANNIPGFKKLGSWMKKTRVGRIVDKGFGALMGLVRRVVSLPTKAIAAITKAAVAMMTNVAVTPGSVPPGGPTEPIHWRHFDEPEYTGDAPYEYEVSVSSSVPLSPAVTNCLNLAGASIPPQGAPREDIPIVWWIADGKGSIPEIEHQTLYQQAMWQNGGDNVGDVPGVSAAAEAVTSRLPLPGVVVALAETDSAGLSRVKMWPRDETGPYEGAEEAYVEASMYALPLTGGLDPGPELAASVVSAIAYKREWTIRIYHHPKLGWKMTAPPATVTSCTDDGECQDATWSWSGFRCYWIEDFDAWWTARDDQIPIEGLWSSNGRLESEGHVAPFGSTFVIGEVGDDTSIGLPDSQADPSDAGIEFHRLEDTPAEGRVEVDLYGDRNGDGELEHQVTTVASVTPISTRDQIPASSFAPICGVPPGEPPIEDIGPPPFIVP
ncbi:MAG: hypothetical protein M3134_09550 [Actinomycetota bacterium]|nr:hypothetical protein [Actinomycetota bacterium]